MNVFILTYKKNIMWVFSRIGFPCKSWSTVYLLLFYYAMVIYTIDDILKIDDRLLNGN